MKTILFISDIHFGTFARSTEFSIPGQTIQDKNDGAKPIIEGIKATIKERNIEYILVGGDLTSKANPLEFYYCIKLIRDIADSCGISNNNTIFCLGNHDVNYYISKIADSDEYNYLNDKDRRRLQQIYNQIAASTVNCCQSEYDAILRKKGPVPCSGIVENDTFTCFVLNSGFLCTHNQEPKRGQLTQTQLQWFEEESSHYLKSEKWKIVLLHHHPIPYSYPVPCGPDSSILEEGSQLIDIAARNRIHLVLHGHRHHPRVEVIRKNEWNQPITFICAGSLAVNSQHRNNGEIPNTMHVIQLHDEIGILTLFNYKYTSAGGWEIIKTADQNTPIEGIMKCGKIFSQEVIDDAVLKAINAGKITEGEIIKKEQLDECLQFQTNENLNKLFQEKLPSNCKMFSDFPNDVYIIRI